ncbi:FAD-dependent oxidoreductase [Puniceicoccus vermicola]|nr:FAD-dependent oxidoreductase [Puniceicoccus vermicola]
MKTPKYYTPETDLRKGEALSCDLCIYGATSAGVVAAIEARRQGLTVVLLAPGDHIGGMTTGGLGFTDFGDKAIIGGISREFYRRLGDHYGVEEEWRFEPSVASKVFDGMMREAGVSPIPKQYLADVEMEEESLKAVLLESGLRVEAGMFMDATYEGDLMAKAGVRYTVGREPNDCYGEFCNGVQVREHHQFLLPVSPYRVPNDRRSGLLPGINEAPLEPQGSGDHKIQAYNFRLCMTQGDGRVPFPKPDDYDPERYELLGRYLDSGWRDLYEKFDAIRGGKTDTNNHGPFSSDFIGGNHAYPEASFVEREEIFQSHVSYHQGLLWFMANDDRVPEDVRAGISSWGLAEDEFTGTSNWPPQLYVREARRMVSDYVITEMDCRGIARAEDVVAFGAYGMDSHNCQRIVVGDRVLNEGDVQIWVKPYPVSYRSLIPSRGETKNLLVPVCLSASHIAYGSVRMEPVFMMLAQACVLAAKLCLAQHCAVQDLSYSDLRRELLSVGQILDLENSSEKKEWLANEFYKINPENALLT